MKIFIISINKRIFFIINDLIAIIINDFNFKKFIQYLTIKLYNVFIKNIKNNLKNIKIKYSIKIYIIINYIDYCDNKIIR